MDGKAPFDSRRRELLQAAGMAGAWLMAPAVVANAAARPMRDAPVRRLTCDVLVLGGGMAGFMAALRAVGTRQRVLLVDKGVVGDSGMSPWAEVVAAATPPPAGAEAFGKWLDEVGGSCEGINDRVWTGIHLRDASRIADELEALGLLDRPALLRGPVVRQHLHDAHIGRLERVMVTSLLKDPSGRVCGALGFSYDDSRTPCGAVVMVAKVVVSCVGSGVFRGPGTPAWGQTHDGNAIAYAAGARITGKEFGDRHPSFDSAAAVDALKGRRWRRERPADPFMARRKHELPVVDGSFTGATLGMGCCKADGVVSTSGTGAADGVPGLYAAGDSLGSMFAGPLSPPGGTSLLASAVQGAVAGFHAGEEASRRSMSVPEESELAAHLQRLWAPRERAEGYSPGWVMNVAQHAVMPFFVSYLKEGRRLRAALSAIAYLREHCVPRLVAADGHQLRLAHETANLLLDQEMRLRASLFREESRGTHQREDFPARDDRAWLCWVDISATSSGQMHLRRRPVPEAAK